MSTDYMPLKKVSARELFDGRLDEFGIREHVKPDGTTEKRRCLTDGRNYMWVYIDDEGYIVDLTRYAGNAAGKILSAVADAFDTEIVSEYEHQYWGFDTKEEWDTWMAEMAKESEEKFHIELLKYLKGEANEIRPGTNRMAMAEIAKTLVENDPSLLLPENKDKLHNEVVSIWRRDCCVTVTLTPQDIARAQMIAADEDDLPRA